MVDRTIMIVEDDREIRTLLGAPTNQILAEAGGTAVTKAPVGGTGANAQTVTPSAPSGAGWCRRR
jgi:hypothetical protein